MPRCLGAWLFPLLVRTAPGKQRRGARRPAREHRPQAPAMGGAGEEVADARGIRECTRARAMQRAPQRADQVGTKGGLPRPLSSPGLESLRNIAQRRPLGGQGRRTAIVTLSVLAPWTSRRHPKAPLAETEQTAGKVAKVRLMRSGNAEALAKPGAARTCALASGSARWPGSPPRCAQRRAAPARAARSETRRSCDTLAKSL